MNLWLLIKEENCFSSYQNNKVSKMFLGDLILFFLSTDPTLPSAPRYSAPPCLSNSRNACNAVYLPQVAEMNTPQPLDVTGECLC